MGDGAREGGVLWVGEKLRLQLLQEQLPPAALEEGGALCGLHGDFLFGLCPG